MNPNQSSIGSKIREYRKRAGMSQLDLELAIDASNGMISRIESDQTNPTKETVKLIGEALELSRNELASLFGLDQPEITPEDITNIKEHLKAHFAEPETFSLLLDSHWNVIMASEGFYLNLGLPRELIDQMIGFNLLELLFNPGLGIRQLIGNADEFYPHELALFNQDFANRTHEAWYKNLMEGLSKHPGYDRYLEESKTIKEPFLVSSKEKTVSVQLGGQRIKLVPQFRYLNIDNRFEIIDYVLMT